MLSVIFTKHRAAGESIYTFPLAHPYLCISNEQRPLCDPRCCTTCSLSLVGCEIFTRSLHCTVYAAFGLLIVPWVDLRVLVPDPNKHTSSFQHVVTDHLDHGFVLSCGRAERAISFGKIHPLLRYKSAKGNLSTVCPQGLAFPNRLII